MRRWLADIRAFTLALVPPTQALITGGIVVAAITVFSAFGKQLPSWSVVALLFVALFAAAFTAWRDEHNLVVRIVYEKLLARCAESLRSGSYPLNALMLSHADELPANEEVVRLCEDLVNRGFAHPFNVEVIGGSLLPLKDLWLIFLREARLRGYKLQDQWEVERVRAQLLDQNFDRWITSEKERASPYIRGLLARQGFDRQARIDAFVAKYLKLLPPRPWSESTLLPLFHHAGVRELRSDDEIKEALKEISAVDMPALFGKAHFEIGVHQFFATELHRGISSDHSEQVAKIYEGWFGKQLQR